METRPWMIEAAHNYLKASRLLWANHLAVPSLMTAAIGVEILFKSFLVEVEGKSGGIGEKYHFDRKKQNINDGHNLLELFDAIPADIKADLNLHKHRSWINDFYQRPFVEDRYPYEKTASGGYTEILTDIGEEILEIIIKSYKDYGCKDPWIENYPDV